MFNLLRKIFCVGLDREQQALERYLASSVDLADLEFKQKEWDRLAYKEKYKWF